MAKRIKTLGEADSHLWHDAFINRVVDNLGYECIDPLKKEEDIPFLSYLEEVTNKSFGILEFKYLLVVEGASTYEECITELNKKYPHCIKIGRRNKFLGFCFFRKKIVQILALRQKD
jgi:hypothetical protein